MGHPPLNKETHPVCRPLIEALLQCHADHPYAKFWGSCNSIKYKLDACFIAEKAPIRAELRRKAAAQRLRFSEEIEERRAIATEFVARREQREQQEEQQRQQQEEQEQAQQQQKAGAAP